LVYPALLRVSGIALMEVPCKEVKTIFRFSFATGGVLKLAFSIVYLIKA